MTRLRLIRDPAAVMMASFAGAIVVGAMLLRLPASARGEPLTAIDALFTATSAVCVTGLVVVDTGGRFSPFGQAVLLGLIQLGGLGIMTFAVFANVVLGQTTFLGRLVVEGTLHHTPSAALFRTLRYVLSFTILAEAVGACLLFLRWRVDFPAPQAAWLAVFHSVSAFCNAGFSLFRDSLVRYRGDFVVNAVVPALFILGGLGFLVNLELRDRLAAAWRRRPGRALSLHARLVLVVNAGLVVLGILAWLSLERDNLLRGLPVHEKALAAWFQATTPRTAGFNTLDLGQATAATLFLTILLMFVGASPGSTGGGVKTTALGLLMALLWSRWRGRPRVMLFRRTVPEPLVDRALAVTLLGWALTSAALLGLVLSEQGTGPHDRAEPRFLALMFEAVSAFGTVGLSTGLTPGLSAAGKLVIIVLMFVGRLGPLTVAVALARRGTGARYRFAEENLMVG